MTIRILGQEYNPGQIALLRQNKNEIIRKDIADFLEEWHDNSPYITVQTSGSTGTPKKINLEKKRMLASAHMTCSFLGLKKGDTALLCMSLKYIGAKMMLVRALACGLDLWPVKPSSHPLRGLAQAPIFASMTPHQAIFCLEDKQEREIFRQIRQIILGGSAVSVDFANRLKEFPNNVWSSYGMTETMSHIALCRLSGEDAADCYTPLNGVRVRLADTGTLAILAPSLCQDEIITNDLASIDKEGRFRILGRKDNVINSGGIKFHIEELEEELRKTMPCTFQITSVLDTRFGEAVTLLVEEDGNFTRYLNILPPHARPKYIFTVPALPHTGSGKPNRALARSMAQNMLEKNHV